MHSVIINHLCSAHATYSVTPPLHHQATSVIIMSLTSRCSVYALRVPQSSVFTRPHLYTLIEVTPSVPPPSPSPCIIGDCHIIVMWLYTINNSNFTLQIEFLLSPSISPSISLSISPSISPIPDLDLFEGCSLFIHHKVH